MDAERYALGSRRLRDIAALAAALVMLGGACTQQDADRTSSAGAETVPASASPVAEAAPIKIGTVAVSDRRCVFDATAGPIGAGPFEIEEINRTDHAAAFDIWQIAEGATFEEFDAHMDKEAKLSAKGKPFIGPPVYAYNRISSGAIAPHRSATIEGDLGSGTWGIVCLRWFQGVEDRFRVSDGVGPIEVE